MTISYEFELKRPSPIPSDRRAALSRMDTVLARLSKPFTFSVRPRMASSYTLMVPPRLAASKADTLLFITMESKTEREPPRLTYMS